MLFFCTAVFLKQFSDLLDSSKIVKGGDHSDECYKQNIQQIFFSYFNITSLAE